MKTIKASEAKVGDIIISKLDTRFTIREVWTDRINVYMEGFLRTKTVMVNIKRCYEPNDELQVME